MTPPSPAHQATGSQLRTVVATNATGSAPAHAWPASTRVWQTSAGRAAVPAGGRRLDPAVRADMEARYAHDFSRVRVHADGRAAAAARAVDAIAYTVGHEVVFGAGRYQPATPAGRRLLAHELAHVVQHDAMSPAPTTAPVPLEVSAPSDAAEVAAGDAAMATMRSERPDRSVALRIRDALRATLPSRPVLHRVATWGGDYTTDKYSTEYDKAKKPIGVHIELRFKPNKHVNARKIGMVQMVTSRDKGKTLALNPTVAARSIPAGQAGEGAHIDQLAQFANPLYATGATAAGDTLVSTATHANWGQHGWRYKDKNGNLHSQDALLIDTPTLGVTKNASQIFETTAVAVEGVQVGTYYGSVQWGWQTNAAGAFTQLALAVVSNDVPSGTFGTAGGLWLANKTSTGAATMPLPVTKGMYTNTVGVWLVRSPSQYTSTKIGTLPKNTRLEMTDKGVGKSYNTDAATRWWRVTVVEGTLIGKVGWVMEKDLSDAKT